MENDLRLDKIVVFQHDEKSLNYTYDKNANKLIDTSILSIDYDVDNFKEYRIIGSEPKVGTVYYRHPYKKNTYVNSELGNILFMEEKLQLFAEIVKLLGGKKFIGTISVDEFEERLTEVKGELKYQFTKVEIDYREEVKNKLSSRLRLEREFAANEILLESSETEKQNGYKKALSIFNDNKLFSEVSLEGMIKSRNPDDRLISIKEKLTIELSNEFNSLLDTAVNLKHMGGIFSLNGKFTQEIEKKTKIIMNVEVEFYDKIF